MAKYPMRYLTITLLLLCIACDDATDCPCKMNDDGTTNFRASMEGRVMMLRVEGGTFIKTDIAVDPMNYDMPPATCYSLWRDLSTGKAVKNSEDIEALESCSLLWEWKRKNYDRFMATDTRAILLGDTVR